ncbi:MAG: Ig-like domain-containing protein [Acidobacteriota bacterium]|nr:Ig-like domain-containing protein [Acidobacteriota bacterium]
MKRALLVVILLFISTMSAYAALPVCMYQDVQSGPATGGEGGNGVYLNIYGVNFGATQGSSTVAVNGTPVAQYLYWGADPTGERQQIGVQIASGSTSGKITVTTAAGACSNLNFTIRAGHIWFIGPNADNSTPGTAAEMKAANSYSTPWGLTNANVPNTNGAFSTFRTPYTYYESCVAPGDFLVFLAGVNYPYYDGRGWGGSLTLDQATTAGSFITLQGRPGGNAILGGGETNISAISNTWSGGYTVYSGLTLVGQGSNGSALNMWNYDRAVGNTLSCPSCRDEAGGGITAAEGAANGIEALGNEITQVSTNTTLLPSGSNKQFHDVYIAGNSWEFAWNRIDSTAAYNGVQVNEDGVSGFYDFSIHDNDIADVNGSGINLSDIDPSSGYVQVYNNVIHHTGIALASDGGSDDPHSCIAVKGYGGSTGTGTVEVYNNTMYDCSSYLNSTGSASSEGESCAIFIPANQLNVTTNMVNNIAYEPGYAHSSVYNVYICGDGTAGSISGSNNIWYSGSTPGSTAYATAVGTIENPLFVNPSNGTLTNFGLQSASPARGAGVSVGSVQSLQTNDSHLTWDFNQAVRPSQSSVGALEYGGTLSADLITIGVTPSAALLGQTVTLTSTVAQTSTSVPSGSITFMNGSSSLGQASLDSAGTATLTLSSLSARSYAVVGWYSGDSHYASGKSAVGSLQVLSSTTSNLVATPNPVIAGQALKLVATLSSSGSTPTSGIVNFMNGSEVLGSASLNASGVATLSTTALSAGIYSLVAQYAGNSSFVANTSSAVSVTVNASTATTATNLVATPNLVVAGQALSLVATVSVSGTTPGSGTVHFMKGANVLGSASLNASGVAALSTTDLPAGTYSMEAQ